MNRFTAVWKTENICRWSIALLALLSAGCQQDFRERDSRQQDNRQQEYDKEQQAIVAPAFEQQILAFSTYDGRRESATFRVEREEGDLRSYWHSTSQPLRDQQPQAESYPEYPDQPRLRSGSVAFDALFALAVQEMQQDSVSEIRDGAYNGGEAIACDCFETGAKWHYVWTRDLAYAAWLGLGFVDPQRVRNSLLFKTSSLRPGVNKAAAVAGSADGLQIIQDTGSGGSWPISSDRVSWAYGAEAALNSLPAAARQKFAKQALAALANTLDNDRLAVFDPASGLYGGEQSFLDWREQSYASWIPGQLASMATAKALSTNVGHYQALQLAVRLAKENADSGRAVRYQRWAQQLKVAINRELWIEEAGLYSSLTAGHFDYAVMPRYDWLGQSLAIISGIADARQRQKILANYPHGPMGAPVIFPQQPGIPVYHNRAIWPFVTAFGLQAAIGVDDSASANAATTNVAVANSAIETLVRGAALNISNMENLEWLSAEPLFNDSRDPALSGPVINSKRQLWSVAAYLGMVVNRIVGLNADADGLRIAPYVSTWLRDYLGASPAIELQNLNWQGKRLDVRLQVPPHVAGEGYYAVDEIRLNGELIGNRITLEQLADVNQLQVTLGKVVAGASAITRVNSNPREFDEQVYAPYEPHLSVTAGKGPLRVSITDERNKGGVYYRLFRNGKQVANQLAAGPWTDPHPDPYQSCYAAVAVFRSSGLESHHSQPVCARVGMEIGVGDARISSSVAPRQAADGLLLPQWGKPDDQFTVNDIRIEQAGSYAIQVKYRNTLNDINTGITCGVKWLQVFDSNNRPLAAGVIQLPHTIPEAAVANFSTPLQLELAPGRYRLELKDFYNMSYLQSNATYSGNSGAGGLNGPVNAFDIYGVRLLPVVE